MSSRHLASSDNGERGRAVERLRAAVAERRRVREAVESAGGKVDDEAGTASLRAADDRKLARDALHSTEAADE
jgi:hypothetical protein